MATNGDADIVVEKLDHNCLDADGIEITPDDKTFFERQKTRLKEIEKKLEEETKRKKKDWEKEVERMKEEFLKLHPEDKVWGSDEVLNDPMVLRRKGSTEVLDRRKMRTLISDSPYSGCKYKLRFDVRDYDTTSIIVKVEKDKNRIIVKATKAEETESGKIIDRTYCRKIEKPPEVDADKVRCVLTNDDVLIVEAALPPHSLNFKSRKHSGSPSHSINSSHSMHSCTSSNRSRSPSGSPVTPLSSLKPNMPTFTGEPQARRMALLVEVGTEFKPPDVSVQVINSTRILIKIRNEDRTPDKVSKKKYVKEFEFAERIEPFSMRSGLNAEKGLLYIVALGRDHNKKTKEVAVKEMAEELNEKTTSCNVLDLAKFPPASNPQTPVKKDGSTTSLT